MSGNGNVQKVVPSLVVSTICPIVLNTTEQIITYKTASTISVESNVDSGNSACLPNVYTYTQVWTDAQAQRCCDYGIQSSLQSNTPIYN